MNRNEHCVHIAVVCLAFLAVFSVMALASSGTSYAADKVFREKCSYDGARIRTDYNSRRFASVISDMEPGDSMLYEITYSNESSKTSGWYMRNSVLETLEDSKDQARNGGYTYILKNGDEVIFSNDQVGGELVVDRLSGLRLATQATENFFFLQYLEPGESQKTTLYVELDGETTVNDYMDTNGALLLTYGVKDKEDDDDEPDDPDDEGGGNDDDDEDDGDEPGGGRKKKRDPSLVSPVRTGDVNRIIYYVVMFASSSVLLVLAAAIYIRDRKKGGQ